MNDFAGYRRFTFFPSYWFAVADLPEDQQLEALSALISYGISGVMPENPSPVARLMLELTIPTIDKSAKKLEAQQTNGRLGGRPRQPDVENPTETQKNPTETPKNPTETQKNPTETQKNPTETQKNPPPGIGVGVGIGIGIEDNGEGIGAGVGERQPAPRFSPPSISDISDFCHEAGITIDVQAFYDFYSSNGWKVGRNSMKDWRAAVRTWARRDLQQQRQPHGRESSVDRARRMAEEGAFDD